MSYGEPIRQPQVAGSSAGASPLTRVLHDAGGRVLTREGDARGKESLSEAIRRTEPEAAVFVVPFTAQIRDALVRERLMAMLSGFFGVIAVLLAFLGLYGVVAYGVTERTREIGIRTALGAPPSAVLGLVLGQSVRLTAVGVALGLAGAVAATRYLEGLLFGLTPLDPGTFISVAVAFPVLAAWAAYLPARRAIRVDPLIALRCE